MNRVFPVDGPTSEFFFDKLLNKTFKSRVCARLRTALRLILVGERVESTRSHNVSHPVVNVNTAVQRFEELIGGRPYLIEAKAVAQNRWRAYIVRIPGVPTALMPFYGRTPDEAVAQLCAWLTRAHERVSKPAGTV